METSSPILWQPSSERLDRCALTAFARFAQQRAGAPAPVPDAAEHWRQLHGWSLRERGAFWSAIWDFAGVVGDRGTASLEHGERMPGAHWFAGSRLNYAENLLAGPADSLALVARDEAGGREQFTRGQLRRRVLSVASGFAAAGIGEGDVVAGFVTNSPAAVIAMLAAAHLGAVWTSVSPEFGAAACVERFGQTGAKLLVATSSYFYAGKRHDCG
jgi:acetoacetyl-CoA synthetase